MGMRPQKIDVFGVQDRRKGGKPRPWAVKGRAARKINRKSNKVDVHALPDPATMLRILDAIASHQPGSLVYQQMTSVVYFAGLRPSEVVMLRKRSLFLPGGGAS